MASTSGWIEWIEFGPSIETPKKPLTLKVPLMEYILIKWKNGALTEICPVHILNEGMRTINVANN